MLSRRAGISLYAASTSGFSSASASDFDSASCFGFKFGFVCGGCGSLVSAGDEDKEVEEENDNIVGGEIGTLTGLCESDVRLKKWCFYSL